MRGDMTEDNLPSDTNHETEVKNTVYDFQNADQSCIFIVAKSLAEAKKIFSVHKLPTRWITVTRYKDGRTLQLRNTLWHRILCIFTFLNKRV